jgi:flavin-dependent dehydrogenase
VGVVIGGGLAGHACALEAAVNAEEKRRSPHMRGGAAEQRRRQGRMTG